MHNEGVATFGGSTQIRQSAVGRGATVNQVTGTDQRAEQDDHPSRADVGIITILSVEANAVRLALGLRRERVEGLDFDLGEVDVPGDRPVKVVATRTLTQGQRSAVIAFDHLRRHHDPQLVVLVGIGGGIHPKIGIGDVVVATRVVHYDLRKELPQHTQHRGEEKEAPAAVGHAVNSFFTEHGEPARFSITDPGGTSRTPRVFSGPIGSGDAVIADRDSEIVAYLSRFNDKILAVDMEAGGLSQACHEQSAISDRSQNWMVIRGISDDASPDKNDDYQAVAAWHAATVLYRVLPYLISVEK
ncbi:5'-methylthioadenosine/S-adenosylhomocysteine nucleosidase [Actinomadura alba]|uniref:5'-methylthioadenosine/S-adenosylhomocysteine nucleosidase family protein n=1 Tax=Actinomadura alba TaxID=406431 RepID=UPI0028A79583|nr:5'-methylthioadenosine/S-adenosylhomocysteine nucleosidase [Actinomadura alba]